jgi:hypothetical protein
MRFFFTVLGSGSASAGAFSCGAVPVFPAGQPLWAGSELG